MVGMVLVVVVVVLYCCTPGSTSARIPILRWIESVLQ